MSVRFKLQLQLRPCVKYAYVSLIGQRIVVRPFRPVIGALAYSTVQPIEKSTRPVRIAWMVI